MNDKSPRLPRERLTEGVSIGGDLELAIADFAAAVIRNGSDQAIIRELVRLRCAQIHDCRLCGSLRIKDALDQGFDEQLQRQIASYETSSLSPQAVAALRLCDAIIMAPSSADDALRDELRSHFTDHEITGLCLDVMKWSQQKALVALRMDAAPWGDTPTTLMFNNQGDPVFGKPVYT
jgi:hypothetical protein